MIIRRCLLPLHQTPARSPVARRRSCRCCVHGRRTRRRRGACSPASLDALSEAGVFRMMAPTRYGGDEADFQTQCDVLAEIARGCPSTSWVATIYSAMAWLAGVFPDEAQDEVFASRDPRISGVFSPTGTAVRQGRRTRRQRPLAVQHRRVTAAQWTVHQRGARRPASDAMPTCVLVRSRELDDRRRLVRERHGGDRQQHDRRRADVFVPAHRAMPLPQMVEAQLPGAAQRGNPYFNYPLAPVLVVNAGGTPIGIARGALETFFERLPGRGIAYTNYTNKAEAPITHLQVGEAALKIESADAHVRRAARDSRRRIRARR